MGRGIEHPGIRRHTAKLKFKTSIARRGQSVRLFCMQNEQWPFNGKSLWGSLEPGQKFAVIVGVPIIHFMFRAYIWLIDWLFPWVMVRAIFVFIGFFALPWVYCGGIGIFIAVVFLLLFARRR